MGDLIMPMGDGGGPTSLEPFSVGTRLAYLSRGGTRPTELLPAIVQLKRRFEEEPVNLHVNGIVEAHADDAADLLRHGK
jgi:hypothetical protein